MHRCHSPDSRLDLGTPGEGTCHQNHDYDDDDEAKGDGDHDDKDGDDNDGDIGSQG